MANKKWTRPEIEAMVRSNPRAVERAMMALLDRQTQDEQKTGSVNHHNHMGFAACNSKSGTYFAKWVQSGRQLNGKHLEKARKIALFHAGQLTDIANKIR
jgi:hypothetical protein